MNYKEEEGARQDDEGDEYEAVPEEENNEDGDKAGVAPADRMQAVPV